MLVPMRICTAVDCIALNQLVMIFGIQFQVLINFGLLS